MRPGVFVARSGWVLFGLIATASSATAEDRLEATGFVGMGFFGNTVQLGDSWAPEQVPGTGALLGGRLTILADPTLTQLDEEYRLQFAIETEVTMTTSNTISNSVPTKRGSYFSPVFGWRANAVFRLDATDIPARPFLLVGGGGATVASESPYMRKETDPLFNWGLGVILPISESWQVRIDARHGIMAAKGGGITNVGEFHVGLGASFGLPEKHIPAGPVEEPPHQPHVDDTDTDRDGLPDRFDECQEQKETVNGLNDEDGCPEPDVDADGIVGAADKCPEGPEDVDKFLDEDGCPETDNDSDGFDDARDACPDLAETRNGFDDDDGCPDELPPEVTKLIATASAKLKFEATRARVTDPGKKVLAPVLEMLQARRGVRLQIVGRPQTAKGADLARRRADAVKWYLIDQGIAEDRFDTTVGEPKKKATPIEMKLLLPQ